LGSGETKALAVLSRYEDVIFESGKLVLAKTGEIV